MNVLIALLFISSGVFVIGIGGFFFLKARRLNSWLRCSGIVTEVIVVQRTDREGNSTASFKLKYRYRPAEIEYTGESSLTSSTNKKHVVTSEIMVAYNPERPAESDHYTTFQQYLYLYFFFVGVFLQIPGGTVRW